jgi:hypothetical protein
MGFDLGALFRSAANAPGSIQQGRQQRTKDDDEAMRAAIQRQLLQANIQDQQAQAAERQAQAQRQADQDRASQQDIADYRSYRDQRVGSPRSRMLNTLGVQDQGNLAHPELQNLPMSIGRQVIQDQAVANARRPPPAPMDWADTGRTTPEGFPIYYDKTTGNEKIGTHRGPKTVGGGGANAQRQALTSALGGSLHDATVNLDNLEQATHGRAAQVSLGQSFGDKVSNAPVVGSLAGPLLSFSGTKSRTNTQVDYQSSQDEWATAYTHSLPGGSRAMGAQQIVKKQFFPPAGVTDPAVIAKFAEKRRAVDARIQRALRGEPQDFSDIPAAIRPPTVMTPTGNDTTENTDGAFVPRFWKPS